jgi:hypothetical protein
LRVVGPADEAPNYPRDDKVERQRCEHEKVQAR